MAGSVWGRAPVARWPAAATTRPNHGTRVVLSAPSPAAGPTHHQPRHPGMQVARFECAGARRPYLGTVVKTFDTKCGVFFFLWFSLSPSPPPSPPSSLLSLCFFSQPVRGGVRRRAAQDVARSDTRLASGGAVQRGQGLRATLCGKLR
eukprot:COSAG01_NODE_10899_length_2056_cov_1.291262_4_plen_147_part_01